MEPGDAGWLTVAQATERTGASAPTVKRYAAGAALLGAARQEPVSAGSAKLRWRLDPEALDRWSRSRGDRGRRPTADASRSGPRADSGLLRRLDALEQAVAALTDRLEAPSLQMSARDEVQAARAVALVEKAVTERVREAAAAHEAAVTAERAAGRLQARAADQRDEAARQRAVHAERLGQALDARSDQLTELLAPGSAAGLEHQDPPGTA